MAKNETTATSSTAGQARVLIVSAAGAFGAGLIGAIWHTQRKQAREAAASNTPTSPTHSLPQAGPVPHVPNPASPSTLASSPTSHRPPTMTAAEYAASKRDARFFAFKTLGYGTLLAFAGAGVLATAVGLWLDVRNFQEFSDKLHIIVPRQTARLRACLGGKALEMTPQEEAELDALYEIKEEPVSAGPAMGK